MIDAIKPYMNKVSIKSCKAIYRWLVCLPIKTRFGGILSIGHSIKPIQNKEDAHSTLLGKSIFRRILVDLDQDW